MTGQNENNADEVNWSSLNPYVINYHLLEAEKELKQLIKYLEAYSKCRADKTSFEERYIKYEIKHLNELVQEIKDREL